MTLVAAEAIDGMSLCSTNLQAIMLIVASEHVTGIVPR